MRKQIKAWRTRRKRYGPNGFRNGVTPLDRKPLASVHEVPAVSQIEAFNAQQRLDRINLAKLRETKMQIRALVVLRNRLLEELGLEE